MTLPNKGLAAQNVVIIRRLSNVLAITLPLQIIQELGWTEGDLVKLNVREGKLEVEKGKLVFE